MRLHRNAKTTPKMRQVLIERVTRAGWTQAAAATAAGISVRTVAKWISRARHGDTALEDGSSRPHRQPRRLDVARTAAIVAARQTRATAWEISRQVGVPRSTVTRVLHQAGLNRVSRLDSPPVIQRYEWPHAGDLLHLDIKPLGRIRGLGHRIVLAASIHSGATRFQSGGGAGFAPVGLQADRGYFSELPWETVDMVNGGAILKFTDLVLPGNAGMDLRFVRQYMAATGTWQFGLEGIPTLIGPGQDDPLQCCDYPVFYGVGLEEKSFPENGQTGSAPVYMTRQFWRYTLATGMLELPNGWVGTYVDSRLVELEDPFQNKVTFGSTGPYSSSVTQHLGNGQERTVTYSYSPTHPANPISMTYGSRTWTFTWPTQLEMTQVQPPAGPAWGLAAGQEVVHTVAPAAAGYSGPSTSPGSVLAKQAAAALGFRVGSKVDGNLVGGQLANGATTLLSVAKAGDRLDIGFTILKNTADSSRVGLSTTILGLRNSIREFAKAQGARYVDVYAKLPNADLIPTLKSLGFQQRGNDWVLRITIGGS